MLLAVFTGNLGKFLEKSPKTALWRGRS